VAAEPSSHLLRASTTWWNTANKTLRKNSTTCIRAQPSISVFLQLKNLTRPRECAKPISKMSASRSRGVPYKL
jgi:hypothetical protein